MENKLRKQIAKILNEEYAISNAPAWSSAVNRIIDTFQQEWIRMLGEKKQVKKLFQVNPNIIQDMEDRNINIGYNQHWDDMHSKIMTLTNNGGSNERD